MPETLNMVDTLLSMDANLLQGLRTQMHVHTSTLYKKGRTKCRLNEPFMPSNETRIVVPFSPTKDEAEKSYQESLRLRYEQMHDIVDGSNFDSTDEFLEYCYVKSDRDYIEILRADYVNKADRGTSDLQKSLMKILEKNPKIEYSAALRQLGKEMLEAV
ncbi:hypothetical protein HPB52_022971 [Rhipicephalus sanguineus]|uniref:Uncharacterized protein n=1 Tax=Rhipicephalus sanguineus TaxID=34632 RepID=A0A9D4PMC4_RHISA|nr:hypothetical protein HPB52_022971 [Rhipicephalus sanguineus]